MVDEEEALFPSLSINGFIELSLSSPSQGSLQDHDLVLHEGFSVPKSVQDTGFDAPEINSFGHSFRTLQQLEDEVSPYEAQMEKLETNLAIMAAKEQQYVLQHANYKELLNRVGYTPEISHQVLVEMAEHKEELEKKTTPIVDSLRSYLDLPPDEALAALAIENKKRDYAAAEKYIEDLLQSALSTTE
ncbi:AUGMIN subunit 1 [Camellia lanceoleosa]|uniref:AUGMIN subunit 1 n=1 Tax=Camellia lanceoleosa TaxID=1840588 RepID=A0ACC0GX41_9ERIC|nr:AUGMIN subunit 1 [Camellia lanceoleosa]